MPRCSKCYGSSCQAQESKEARCAPAASRRTISASAYRKTSARRRSSTNTGDSSSRRRNVNGSTPGNSARSSDRSGTR